VPVIASAYESAPLARKRSIARDHSGSLAAVRCPRPSNRCNPAAGFHAEGLLRNHVRGRRGELRDLMLFAHPVADHWSAMETAGIDDAVASP
jgi:hypothetical protein